MDAERCIAEWRRSQSALQSAAVLRRAALYPDSVARAYYAILHGTRAALATIDLIPNSHSGARDLFNQFLIHTGEIEREWLGYFNRASTKRTAADYDVMAVITEPMAAVQYRDADHFTTRIRRYLQTQGFTDGELAVILPG